MRLLRIYKKKEDLYALACTALAAFFFALVSCGRESAPAGRNIIVGIESNPTQFDPRFSQDAVSSQVQRFLFNRLITRDANGRLVLELAKRWERPSPRVHRFRLRRPVRFHDGSFLTSADVKYTFESMRDPSMGSPKAGGLRELDRIETPAPDTITFYLKEPSAAFVEALSADIVPLKRLSAGRRIGERPIGTGPFRFIRYVPDERIELQAFPHYFGGKPSYDNLIFRILPEETIRILELESGGIHFIQNAFTPDLLPRFEANPRLRIKAREGTNFTYIGFNLSDPILSRIKVRRAIAHAINRRPIILHILKGLATEADSLLPGSHWAHRKGLPRFEHNPELAARLLDEAGLPDPDGGGPRPRFSLVYKTSQNELRRRIATVIAGQLKKVGIEVKVRSYEWGTFFSDIRNGNFQIYSLTWVGISDPDIYRHIFHSKFVPPDGLNRGGYSNEEVDTLVEKARGLSDPSLRAPLYKKVQKILANELPYVNLWHGVNVAVHDRRIIGYRVYPNEDLISLAWAQFRAPQEKVD